MQTGNVFWNEILFYILFPPRRAAARQACQEEIHFQKVSALVHSLYNAPSGATFQNVHTVATD